MLTSLASSPTLSPRAAPLGAVSIDASLARGILRTYFRELEGQWKRLKKARTQAIFRCASEVGFEAPRSRQISRFVKNHSLKRSLGSYKKGEKC
jgi:hypothetical protein